MALMLLLPLGCIIGWYHQAFANSVHRGYHGYSGGAARNYGRTAEHPGDNFVPGPIGQLIYS